MDEQHPVTRRRVVVSAAGAAFLGFSGRALAESGTVVSAQGDPFCAEGKELLAGRIVEILSSTSLELATGDGVRVVEFAPDALVWREGRAELSEFQPGEDVLIEGSGIGEGFRGSAMLNKLVDFEATVKGRSGSELETSQGRIQFTDKTRYQHDGNVADVDSASIPDGAQLVGLGRVDVNTDDIVAVRIY
jgi:hypothetical protein